MKKAYLACLPFLLLLGVEVANSLRAPAASASSSKFKKPTIVLWNSGVWPFAQRPWIALEELVAATGLEFEHKIIDLSDKPQEFRDKYSWAQNGGSFPQVPLLEHDDILITESIEVSKYIGQYIAPESFGERHDDDESAKMMYPVHDQAKRDLVDSFIDVWDNEITSSYYSCLTATSEKSARTAQKKFTKSLKQTLRPILLESRQMSSEASNENESGAFLLGPNFSVAECIAAPWVQRFYFVLEHFRGVNFRDDILEECDADDDDSLPVVKEWMEAVLKRPSVQKTECPHDEMVAAAMRYYVSYVSPGSPAATNASL